MRVGLVVLLTLAPAAAAVTSRYQRKAALGTPCDDLDGAACGPGAGAAAADGVEQVHVTGGSPFSAVVTFVSDALGDAPPTVVYGPDRAVATGASATTSSLNWINAPVGADGVALNFSRCGEPLAADQAYCALGAYTNDSYYYASAPIHRVQLDGLAPSTTYAFEIPPSNATFAFATPPAPAAGARLRVALTADLGQTDDSLATMTHIKAAVDGGEADLVLFPGDLSYADGYGPRWDSYGRLSEFLFASVPAAYAPGNHEFGNGEGFAHYLARYAPPAGPPAARAGGGLWHAFDAGPAHFVLLCAYCDTSPGSLQYRWLSADLAAAAANRATSPWIVAAWHAPMYNSNTAHQREPSALRFQANFEPLFLEYGVDLCFAGHVHSYERTTPVAAGAPAKCAPVHVGIGDGGNREGPAAAWLNESETPAWSAFREASFGHGLLDIRNATSARWTWYRNDDGDKQAGDDVWIERCAGGGVNYAP